jgi:hypothetical protein
MVGESEVAAAAHLNFVASFRKLAQHTARGAVREKGSVFAFTTGLPISLFNGCVVTDTAEPDDVRAAIDWVAGHGLAHRVWVSEPVAPSLGSVLAAASFRPDPRPYPGMVLNPVPRWAFEPSSATRSSALRALGKQRSAERRSAGHAA